jgi:hypothetical protein
MIDGGGEDSGVGDGEAVTEAGEARPQLGQPVCRTSVLRKVRGQCGRRQHQAGPLGVQSKVC